MGDLTGRPVVRVWREPGFFGLCWVELWTPRIDGQDMPESPVDLTRAGRPRRVPGCKRRDVAVTMTRWGARRKGRRMRARWLAGLHPSVDDPEVEIIG